MKKIFTVCLLLLLCLLCLPTGVFALTKDNLDMSTDLYYEPYTLSPSALLEEILGEKISEAEAAYLDEKTDLVFRLHDAIPADRVTTVPQEDGLLVRAEVYRYTARSGGEVVWIPRDAAVGLTRAVFDENAEGVYECFLTGITEGNSTDLTVSYTTAVTVPDETANELARLAYPIGREALDSIELYRHAHKGYLDAKQAYEDYQIALTQFEKDQADYLLYRETLAAYEEAHRCYEDYLAAKAAYDVAYEKYTVYQEELTAYQEAYKNYTDTLCELLAGQEAMREYLAYTAAVRTCVAKLAPMDYIMDPVGHLYLTLMGDTVATVVNNKNLLVAAGCNANDIDTCAVSTETLRRLLPLYAACETEEARYAFYREHHSELLSCFTALQKSLYGLFGNSLVQAELDNKGKLERFVQFVGQLYIARTLLDDSLTLSDSWSIDVILAHKKRTYSLEEALAGITAIPKDRGGNSPQETAWPNAPTFTLPENAEIPDEPTAPTPVERPVEPERVSDPGEPPEEVKEPKAPQEVKHPGEEPVFPVTDPYILALAEAVESGEMQPREALHDCKITRRTLLHKYIAYDGRPVVTFYDFDGKTVIGRSEPNADGSAAYNGPSPSRPADRQFEYVFDGWVDCYGKAADLSCVTKDLAVYACYHTEPLHYTVTWIIGEDRYTSRHVYGEMPICPQDTARPSDSLYHYGFAGWDKPLLPVTGEATYEATYTAEKRQYSLKFSSLDGETETLCPAGETPAPPTPTPYLVANGYLLSFTGWDKDISPVLADTVYTALYSRAVLVLDRGSGSAAEVEIADGLYTVRATRDMNFAKLLALAAKEKAAIRFEAENAVLHLPVAVVEDLADTGAAILKFRFPSANGAGVLVRATVEITDARGAPLAELPSGVSLRFVYPDARGEYAEIYRESAEGLTLCPTSHKDGYLSASVQNGTYSLVERFPVRSEKPENGALAADRYTVAAGETVRLTLLPASGYKLGKLTVIRTDTGEELTVTDACFVMPNSPVSVIAEFEEIFYTVRFESEGKELVSLLLRPGETLTPPSDPTHTDSENYVFAGWSPVLSEIVTEDVTYTAVFHERKAQNDYTGENDNNRLFTTYLPIAGGVALLPAVGLFLFFKLRRKKTK